MTRLIKIETGTYRKGDYIIFKTVRNFWKFGIPIDWNDPICGGLLAGTVGDCYRTLRSARRSISFRERRDRAASDAYRDIECYRRLRKYPEKHLSPICFATAS